MHDRNLAPPLFALGRTMATPAAIDRMTEHGINHSILLDRHSMGDWGDTPPEDARANDAAVQDGERVISWYGQGEQRLMVLTEADRSATTILCPGDY
jgi:hypothetical protein